MSQISNYGLNNVADNWMSNERGVVLGNATGNIVTEDTPVNNASSDIQITVIAAAKESSSSLTTNSEFFKPYQQDNSKNSKIDENNSQQHQ